MMRIETNFHGYERRMALIYQRIWPEEFAVPTFHQHRKRKYDLTSRNREILREYRIFLENQNYRSARLCRLIEWTAILAEMLGKDFDTTTVEDIQGSTGLVSRVIAKYDNDTTKENVLQVLKQFYKWLKKTGDDLPNEVKGIRLHHKKGKRYPKALYTKEDIAQMVDAADHPMKKALISLLFTSAARISELGLANVEDIEFTDSEMVFHIRESKTDQRPILIVNSTIQLMKDWLSIHPHRHKPHFRNSPLFCTMTPNHYGKRVTYETICKYLKETAAIAKIDKPTNPHHLRHSWLTQMARDGFNQYQIQVYAGHAMGSRETAKYVHIAGTDLFDQIRIANGLKTKQEMQEDPMRIKRCEVCGFENDYRQRTCKQCLRPVGLKEKIEIKNEMNEVIERMKKLENAYHLLLNAHLETLGVENENK